MSAPLDYAPAPPRRSHLRHWMVAFSVLFFLAAIVLGAKYAVHRYWLNRAMNYQAPADRAVWVYDEMGGSSVTPPPPEAVHLDVGISDSVIYLHAMYVPGGPRRIVVLDAWGSNPIPVIGFKVLSEQADWLHSSMISSWPDPTLRPARVRIFAGQADPHDAAHFSFVYEIDGLRHTYDGWLRHDDSLLIQPR